MKKVSFCGISGSGMSALAQILKLKGYEVCGSDRSFDQGNDVKNKQALLDMGIKLFPQDGSAIVKDLDCLYISTAVEESIPDVKAALEKGIKIQKRSDLLAEIFHQYTNNIAVGGTSGKTTVTAMIGFVLDILGLMPCMVNGGLLKNYEKNKGIPNFIYNNGDTCVIEADESDGSIEKYHPYIAVINNISIDHKTIDELRDLFIDFASRAKHAVIVNADCPNTRDIKHPHKKTLTFSVKNPRADFYATGIKPIPNGVQYSFGGRLFKLNLIGDFNVSNALAAIAACSVLGVDKFDAALALEKFLGTKRRLDVIGSKKGITVIDDFAHNPDKVDASMSALRSYPGRLMVMFQPHGFAPMRMMGREIMEAFAKNMEEQDVLLMPEIFFAGGTVKRDISSKDLIDHISKLGKNGLFFETREDIKKFLLLNAKSGDRIVIMGARDNTLTDFCEEILNEI